MWSQARDAVQCYNSCLAWVRLQVWSSVPRTHTYVCVCTHLRVCIDHKYCPSKVTKSACDLEVSGMEWKKVRASEPVCHLHHAKLFKCLAWFAQLLWICLLFWPVNQLNCKFLLNRQMSMFLLAMTHWHLGLANHKADCMVELTKRPWSLGVLSEKHIYNINCLFYFRLQFLPQNLFQKSLHIPVSSRSSP